MGIIRFKPIARNLRDYNPKRIQQAFELGLGDVGKIIDGHFRATTKTWSPGGTDGKPIPGGLPKFRQFGPRNVYNTLMLEISTSHGVYYYLNFGTRAHPIKARRARALRFRTQGRGSYRAKTRQGWLGSGSGGPRGPWVLRRAVGHPGNWGRGWDITITETTARRQELSKAINARLRQELGATGGMARAVRS